METCYDSSLYPWGLKLFLDDETLDKLSMDATDFKMGDTFPLTVMIEVQGMSKRENQEGSSESVDLQITDIEKPTTEGGRAKRMFSSMKTDDD